jgi:hypothetical protein
VVFNYRIGSSTNTNMESRCQAGAEKNVSNGASHASAYPPHPGRPTVEAAQGLFVERGLPRRPSMRSGDHSDTPADDGVPAVFTSKARDPHRPARTSPSEVTDERGPFVPARRSGAYLSRGPLRGLSAGGVRRAAAPVPWPPPLRARSPHPGRRGPIRPGRGRRCWPRSPGETARGQQCIALSLAGSGALRPGSRSVTPPTSWPTPSRHPIVKRPARQPTGAVPGSLRDPLLRRSLSDQLTPGKRPRGASSGPPFEPWPGGSSALIR